MEIHILYELIRSAGEELGKQIDLSNASHLLTELPVIFADKMFLDGIYENISKLPPEAMNLLVLESAWLLKQGSAGSSSGILKEVIHDMVPEKTIIPPEENIASYDGVFEKALITASEKHLKEGNIFDAITCEERLIDILGRYEQTPEIMRQTAYAYGHLAKLYDEVPDIKKETKYIYSEVALFSKVLERMDDSDYAGKARINYDSAQAIIALGDRMPKKPYKNRGINKKYSSKTKCFFQALKRLDAAGRYQDNVVADSPYYDPQMKSRIMQKKIKCYYGLSEISHMNKNFGDYQMYCKKIVELYGKLSKSVVLDILDPHEASVIKIYEDALRVSVSSSDSKYRTL